MPACFQTTRRVQFADTDMAGIVHFATFFNYLEEAEHEMFRTCGTSIMQQQPDGSIIGWPRVAASCSFEAPARYDNVLEIRLAQLTVGSKSLTQLWEVWCDEKRLCRGELTTVCCLFRPGEPMASMAIPVELRRQLEAVAAGRES
jgi:YbgC/YbaW family acyl-CoA thioester hydrolase